MTYFIFTMLAICVGALLYALLLSIRNQVVFSARTKAAAIVFKGDGNWRDKKALYDLADSYEEMLWQFAKWKVEDFFPELVEATK